MLLPTPLFPAQRRNPAPLIAALILIAIAAWPAIGYRNAQRQVTAMLAAPTCPAATDCRTLVDTRIADISGSKTITIRIDSPAAVAGEYTFNESDDVAFGASTGDPITAEVWHGHVVALSDSGGRTDTGASPIIPENQALALAIALAAIALALLTKYATRATALAVVPPNPKQQWRIDLRSPRSIAYNVSLFVAVAAAFGALAELTFNDGGITPLTWMIIATPTIALAIVGNTLWGDRHTRSLAGRRPLRLVCTGFLLLVAALAVFVTFVAAFSYHDRDKQRAGASRAAHAPLCAPGGSTIDCLRNQEVGIGYVDTSGDEPAIYISDSSLPPQWVFFSPADEAFVDSLGNDFQAIVTIYNDRIVAVSATDGSPVATDLAGDPGDHASIGEVIGLALVSVALLVGVVAVGRRLIPRRRMSAAIPELLPTRRP